MEYTKEISESVEELRQLERTLHNAKCRDRLRFIRFLKSGKATIQKQAGSLIGIGERQRQKLWRNYKSLGIIPI